MKTYGKALVPVLVAVVLAVIPVLSGDHRIDPPEWVAVLIALFTALAVYVVPLFPRYPWAKTAVGAVLAALGVLATVVLNGWPPDLDDWLTVVTTLIGALGIRLAPAASPATRTAVGWGSDVPVRIPASSGG